MNKFKTNLKLNIGGILEAFGGIWRQNIASNMHPL